MISSTEALGIRDLSSRLLGPEFLEDCVECCMRWISVNEEDSQLGLKIVPFRHVNWLWIKFSGDGFSLSQIRHRSVQLLKDFGCPAAAHGVLVHGELICGVQLIVVGCV
ncbi:hypothetical protein Droror1_Dr00021090 [Drosera rotundifolia]